MNTTSLQQYLLQPGISINNNKNKKLLKNVSWDYISFKWQLSITSKRHEDKNTIVLRRYEYFSINPFNPKLIMQILSTILFFFLTLLHLLPKINLNKTN